MNYRNKLICAATNEEAQKKKQIKSFVLQLLDLCAVGVELLNLLQRS